MYPPDLGLGSYGKKDGRVRPVAITGTLLPYSSCCPRRHVICDWLIGPPFAPELTIRDRRLRGNEWSNC